jgi:hypothetical protein
VARQHDTLGDKKNVQTFAALVVLAMKGLNHEGHEGTRQALKALNLG